jgi:RNA polymerase sigma-70 factor (ECF subfamily)
MRLMLSEHTEAFSELILQHYAGVYRMALSILRHTHDAEELCQDAFARAYENLSKFDSDRSTFKTWIYTIAYRLILNRIRSDRTARKAIERHSSEPIVVKDASELSEMSERLDAVIRGLDPEDQMLLHYRFRDDLKFQEIAQIVSSTEAAVRVRFFRLLARIRGDLKP